MVVADFSRVDIHRISWADVANCKISDEVSGANQCPNVNVFYSLASRDLGLLILLPSNIILRALISLNPEPQFVGFFVLRLFIAVYLYLFFAVVVVFFCSFFTLLLTGVGRVWGWCGEGVGRVWRRWGRV